MFGFISDLESIEFFQYSDGYSHFVVLKIGQSTVVKQQYARVQDKNLCFYFNAFPLGNGFIGLGLSLLLNSARLRVI